MASNLEPKTPLSLNILHSYFQTVSPLQDYLSRTIESGHNDTSYLIHETDTLLYRILLKQSYVACQSDLKTSTQSFTIVPPMVPLREVIERAQYTIFRKIKGRPSNILTAGYRLPRNGVAVKQGGSATCLTNYYVNTIVTALQSDEWDVLYRRIGEDAMLHLLTETCIFVPLPNECLCQMTGDPIVHTKPPQIMIRPSFHRDDPSGDVVSTSLGVKRKMVESRSGEPAAKRLKMHESVLHKPQEATCQTQERTPADVGIVRPRMFYFRPYYVSHSNNIAIGLPPKHVLNRLNPSHSLKFASSRAEWIEPDPRKQMEHARHLARYIFPRQYELSNPFTIDPTRFDALRLPNYFDREDEIKQKGSCKTPKRLKSVLGHLEKMLWRHGKCGYKPLLEKVCPSKLKSEQKSLDSSVILEMMSEHSINICSQAHVSDATISVDSSGHPIQPQGLSQAQRLVKNKPRFAEFVCSHVEVFRYAMLITRVVIPKMFWGSERNFQLISSRVKDFITARRYETLTLHRILQGFNTSDCDWLAPNGPQQARVCLTDSLKRRELMEEFIFWYFDSFLIPLIRTTFYVTESSAFRNKVLYFRQNDWTTLCKPLIEKLSLNTFQKIEESEAEEILRQRKLGYSFVRLLPKETGVRPIVNLRRKKAVTQMPFAKAEPSINQILQAAFQILTYEKEAQKKLLGASVFGPHEIYAKLKSFKSRLSFKYPGGKFPKLYFVKVDVQACFDTIKQGKLLQILREVLSENRYMIQRHGQVSCVAGKIKRTYAKKAIPDDDHPHFLSFAAKLADALRSVVFSDLVVYPHAQRQEILELLEEHITENIVKIGDRYYRQTIGIPQGSVLSAILCSFFYGDLERRKMKFTEDTQSVLLRMIDDYLLITTSRGRAKKFLGMMSEGHPEYGCFISKEKTLTNLETEEFMSVVDPNQKAFPWCGYLINMSDLSVTADYGRFHETYLQDSLTVDVGRRAGGTFVQKMMQFAKSKSHILYCDSFLNSSHTVFLNIYQNFMLCAMKMHYYLRSWKLNIAKSSKFILNTIRQMIKYTYASIRNKATSKIAKTHGGQCEVQKIHILWLGTHAFHVVLSRRAQVYSSILKPLEFDMSLLRYRQFKKRFRSVAREGLEMMSVLAF